MNWVTTNIRLPKDDYMELKMVATKRRISFNALVRERLGLSMKAEKRNEFWKKLDNVARRLANKYPDNNLSNKLIEMRYEQ